ILGLPPFLKGGGIVLGIFAGAIIGMAAQYFLKIHRSQIKTHKEVFLSVQKIKDTSLTFLKRSLKEAIAVGGLALLVCLFLLPLVSNDKQLPFMQFPLWLGLIIGVFFGLLTLVTRLVSDSLIEKKEVKTLKPNQGILDSYKKAYLIAKITTGVVAVINTLFVLMIHGVINPHPDKVKLLVTLILGLCSAFVTGGAAAFIHDSGRVCQQHFALRIVLYLTGDIPWNYKDFLDYASKSTKLDFLNKIGGGYQFFHGLFKEHLASLYLDQKNG
ncbi:MAG: hypothetical protein SFW36_13635, partial [Leptolyngbyaceae cyanobacterium bins.59]|nr:hypothetical protein [Leptolyngbyaceae cyanobacterium bins.59]